jgi:hypothetical protein
MAQGAEDRDKNGRDNSTNSHQPTCWCSLKCLICPNVKRIARGLNPELVSIQASIRSRPPLRLPRRCEGSEGSSHRFW